MKPGFRRMLVAVVTVTALSVAVSAVAEADTSGPVVVQLGVTSTTSAPPPPVRSITVSPTTVSYGNCDQVNGQANLTFPNGECSTTFSPGPGQVAGIVITNGTVAGHVDVQTSNLIPSDDGTPWTPCKQYNTSSPAPMCTGPLIGPRNPGTDEFTAITSDLALSDAGSYLAETPGCDEQFDAGDCVAAAGASSTEAIDMIGPTVSSDSSLSFSQTITWTAVP